MNILKRTGKRMLAALLCLTLALTIPVLPATTASAANWLTPYLDKMTSWGVVKGDGAGNMNTGNVITRAEFVAMMNRAYGYTDMGEIPFTDVSRGDWFYEDICKAYKAGVFHGTSATKASPFDPITREQAITLIARNMRMDEIPGEIIDFNDGRLFSPYSRGYVQAAIASGIISGYPDGSCRPQQNVTRGEAIKMMCVGIGSLINSSGTHAPGGVFGNLTINCTNVTLKDTIITGDLYISGGVSLGDVVLENVQVRGRIVVAGGGASELGQNSVLLRGVDTEKLIVDAPTGQYVSVRTEGRTHIRNGAFRSDAFLDDGCRDGYGVLNVSLEGDPGDSFTLSGNLETVVNRTPDSLLILGDAQAASVTVDEKATNSKLLLEVNASADEVNLDIGTAVEGTGDIGHLTINSIGSSTTMLPDKITIRPGLNADISGDDMDASEAQQYSEEPRILNGYPKVKNVAPTSADGIHSTNKKGTVYWGLTTAAVGAIPDTDEGREKLIAPSYGSGLLLYGNYEVESADQDFAIPEGLKGLTSSGTYFISAVLVDSRGHQSPVYSERFETPDDIIPAFSSRDYPYMSSIEVNDAEVTVMANKNCDMYYALLPKGSTQPTPNDFLAFSSFEDALGYGRIHLPKNKTETQQVNLIIYPESMNKEDEEKWLDEQASYDLYLWLTDADGIKSSAVTKLPFTTRDKTPPQFIRDGMEQQMPAGTTNAVVNGTLNEAGTIYWAIVKTGAPFPDLPKNWTALHPDENFLESEDAKFQIINPINASRNGSIATTGNVKSSVNITGLEKETAYDFYYIAVDKAGNYSDIVKKITIYTDDSTPPEAELSFSRVAPNTGTATVPPQPYADADVRIEFSENILDLPTSDEPLELYQNSKDSRYSTDEQAKFKERLVNILKKNIKLQQLVGGHPIETEQPKFENATLELDRTGKLILTLPGSGDNKAITLGSGSTYRFEFKDITDASPRKNEMKQIHSASFITVSALAELDRDVIAPKINIPADCKGTPDDENGPREATIDIGFSMTPESTASSEPGLWWDMKLWFDAAIDFDLYRRERPGEASDGPDGWEYVGKGNIPAVPPDEMRGITLSEIKTGQKSSNGLATVKGEDDKNLREKKTWEYAIHVTKIGSQENRKDFTTYLTCQVQVMMGMPLNLGNVLNQITLSNTETKMKELNVMDITSPPAFSVSRQFVDGNAPQFSATSPSFKPGDNGVEMDLELNRDGTIYYVIAQAKDLRPRDKDNHYLDRDDGKKPDDDPVNNNIIPTGGIVHDRPDQDDPTKAIATPNVAAIMNPKQNLKLDNNATAKYGVVTDATTINKTIPVTGLQPETMYYAYFVIEGGSNTVSPVYVYRFTTTKIVRPTLTLTLGGSSVGITSSHTGTVSYILLTHTGTSWRYLGIDGTDWADDNDDGLLGYQALSRDSTDSSEKGSEYDRLATDTHKASLAQAIRTSSDGNPLAIGGKTISVKAGERQTIDFAKEYQLAANTNYILLAVATSDTGSADAFRATYPVRLIDTTPPEVTSISNALSVTTSNVGDRINGQIVINFSEYIFYKDTGASDSVDPKKFCFHKIPTTTDTTTASPTSICSSPNVHVVGYLTGSHKKGQEPNSNQIYLEFTEALKGESVSLHNVITDEAGNRIKPITISFDVKEVGGQKEVIVKINNKVI